MVQSAPVADNQKERFAPLFYAFYWCYTKEVWYFAT